MVRIIQILSSLILFGGLLACTESGDPCATADGSCAALRAAILNNAGAQTPKYIGTGVVNQVCAIQTSVDGENWGVVHTDSSNCSVVTGAAKGNGVYVGIGGDGGGNHCAIFRSTDGEIWNRAGCPTTPETAGYLLGMVFAAGQFVAVGPSSGSFSTILSSTDGQNWTFHGTTLNQLLWDVAYAYGQYYYGAANGLYTASDPSANPTVIAATSGNQIRSISVDDSGRILATSDSGSSFISQDGTNFSVVSIATAAASSERPHKSLSLGQGFLALAGNSSSAGADCLLDISGQDGTTWNGGYNLHPFCVVEPSLRYDALMLTRAGDFFFASGYEASSGIAGAYLARAIDPADPNGWVLHELGTSGFSEIIVQ